MAVAISCSLSFAFLLTGCVATRPVSDARSDQANRIPDRYSMPLPVEEVQPPPEGSIYSEQYGGLYNDSRAREVGDIILVKIVETSSGAKKAETKLARDSKLTGGIAALLGFENWYSNRNANFTPSSSNLQAGLKNDFDGKGETTRDSKITATVSARVVEKTLDGNLIIRGFREIRLNNETQHIILTGMVRPRDISTDNSVLSSYIADARIEYGGTGIIADKQEPGWLARGLDLLWPF